VYFHIRYHDRSADIEVDAETVFKECIAYKSAETKQIEALGPKAALESALSIARPLTQLSQTHKHRDVLNPRQTNAIGAMLGTRVPGQDYAGTLDNALANDMSHHPTDKNAGLQQHIQDWLESADSNLAANGKLAHVFQSKMPKSSARLHLLHNQLSPVKTPQSSALKTAGGSPEYGHPAKKTKPGAHGATKMAFAEWAVSPLAKTQAGLARCFGMYKHGSCYLDEDPARSCKFDHSL
jgi:hypothetical protein